MIYELAKAEDLQTVYDVVQHTIRTIYPKYYPAEVVNFFSEHHSMEAIARDIENGYVSVLKIDENIMATGCFVDNHITRVYVLPEYQKKGYGTFIMKTIETQIGKKYGKAYLDASLPAAALYEKLGFSTIKHERYPVENGVILTYEVMEKELHQVSTRINYDGRKFIPKMNLKNGEVSVQVLEENTDALYMYLNCLPDSIFEYKKATIEDIDELVRTRIVVLRAANKLLNDVDMSVVEKESYAYYKRALETGEHIAYLVYDNGTFIGAGGVSFYQVMPTYHNPTGKKAYIMNMYTVPEYRRQGIAIHTLDLLVKDAKEQRVSQIALEATDMGRPLYEKYGFVKMEDEMEFI